MKIRSLITGLFALGLLTACQQENNITSIPEPTPEIKSYEGVDQELWEYFQRFEEEGLARGFEFDLNAAGITGVIQEIHTENVAGQCNYSSFSPNHVIIDEGFWNSTSDAGKEFVVFHELGHCELARDHREDEFPNGTCQSLMRSGVGGCRDAYNNSTRAAYLDELFDPAFWDSL